MIYLILDRIVFKEKEQKTILECFKNYKKWTVSELILPLLITILIILLMIGLYI